MVASESDIAVVVQRLTEIERRLAEGEDDIKGLTRSNAELTAAIAGLTAKIAALPAAALAQNGVASEQMLTLLTKIADRLGEKAQPAPAAAPPTAAIAAAGGVAGAIAVIATAIYTAIAPSLGLPR